MRLQVAAESVYASISGLENPVSEGLEGILPHTRWLYWEAPVLMPGTREIPGVLTVVWDLNPSGKPLLEAMECGM